MRRKVKELDPYIKASVGEAIIQLTELTKPYNLLGTQKCIILATGQKIYTTITL
jgi:hypothetical protein